MDIQKLMQQAEQMQSQLGKVEEELAKSEYIGTAGGDGVKIVLKGNNIVESVEIDSELLEVDNKEMLQDLLVIAFNNASDKALQDKENKMKSLTGGMSIPGMF
ncbi:MAG: YbaB/EbfC family nucleoid-associated protein [Erysipelotrichaceae bacterium]|nr:YbaB/EbfC family nucleoid-associated protein [Erysipelotrichaceae bacterium]